MRELIADLHFHTTASDGVLAPSEAVRFARDAGVEVLAITDHDTLAGHAEAAEECARLGLRFIPGLELSAHGPRGEVHMLGYGLESPKNPSQQQAHAHISTLCDLRSIRAKKMLALLTAHGIHITLTQVQALAGDSIIGRPHIARTLLQNGHVASLQEAFDQWLAEGRPAFAAHTGLNPQQAIDLIHRAGGVAILAHPRLYAGDWVELAAACIAAGVDGFEAHHPSADDATIAQVTALARKHNLLITGGSDFHEARPDAPAVGVWRTPALMLPRLDARIAQHAR